MGMSIGNDISRRVIQKRPELKDTLVEEIGTIVSAACLAHDLGNPPFGHSGEKLGESTVQESEQTVSGRLMYDDPVQTAVFRAQSQVIRNIACQEPCVIVGRLANFVLKDRPACLHLFIYADEATRRKRIASEYGVADNRTQSLLKRIDQERREHCLHYTGCEWGERHYYHMMLDSSISGDEQIVETICNVIRTISGRKHPNERKK